MNCAQSSEGKDKVSEEITVYGKRFDEITVYGKRFEEVEAAWGSNPNDYDRDVPIVVIEDIVLLYRRHDQNMTRDIEAGLEGLMRTVKQSLDRRRRDQQTAQTLPLWETLGRHRP